MSFCECNSQKYRWRDILRLNGKYYKVDEEVYLVEEEKERSDATFDISPTEQKLAKKFGVDTDDIELCTFINEPFPEDVVEEIWGDALLGGYCAVCGGDI